jgi:NAD(P)-dependent dehydrogenase (short-subunit alcohol dehydrogenase family)
MLGTKLQGKVAIITGGAGGIGSAGARLFAREGARVVIADIDCGAGQALEGAIRKDGGEACFIPVDVSVGEQVQAMMVAVMESHGRIDVLWNNATALHGCSEHDAPVHELPEAEWDFIQNATLRSVYLCSKYALPHMMSANRGALINTSSTEALIGLAGYDSYTAAKGGIVSMTRSMAAYYGRYNIRVNTICPSFVRTPATSVWLDDPKTRQAIDALHLTAVGEPEDIANFALYLASDDARFVTGGVFPIDGGYTCFKTYATNDHTTSAT